MCSRVVVVKVVDAVDPGAAPTIRPEQRLEGAFGLAGDIVERKRVPVENKRSLELFGTTPSSTKRCVSTSC
jgi:hypothetical protein